MSEDTVYVTVSTSRSQWGRSPLQVIQDIVSRIPKKHRSGTADAELILQKAGVTALDHIKKAFVEKSYGSTDEAGDRWKDLDPKTVAYKAARTKTERKREARPSQALNKKQQSRWWQLYNQALAMYKGDKSHAAARAWFILKSEGATTLFDKYSNSQHRILYDTGELLNSLTSSIQDGQIVITAKRKGAAAHHYGVPNRLPQRRLWPEPVKWPSSWWNSIANSVRDGILESVKSDLRGGELT